MSLACGVHCCRGAGLQSTASLLVAPAAGQPLAPVSRGSGNLLSLADGPLGWKWRVQVCLFPSQHLGEMLFLAVFPACDKSG